METPLLFTQRLSAIAVAVETADREMTAVDLICINDYPSACRINPSWVTQNLSMRQLKYLVAILLMTIGGEAAEQKLRLAIGHSASVALEENPSTGYRWAVDTKASSGLSIVRIDDRGFSEREEGKRLLGAPGIHRWDIQAVSAGTANVVFIYRRPWENKPARSHEVAVEATVP